MKTTYVIACLMIVTSGLALPLPLATANHCGQTVVSDTSALWVHGEIPAPTGQAEAQTNSHGWFVPAGATPIWKPKLLAEHLPTISPVVFVQTFTGQHSDCLGTGALQISADNSFIAQINGVTVAACGAGPSPGAEGALGRYNCYGSDMSLTSITGVNIPEGILLPAPAINTITVEAWNHAAEATPGGLFVVPMSPAMVAYRLDY